MDASDQNLDALANYLAQTVSPDPAVRKPGRCACVHLS